MAMVSERLPRRAVVWLILIPVVALGMVAGYAGVELALRAGLLGEQPTARRAAGPIDKNAEQKAAALVALGDKRKAGGDHKGALEAYTQAIALRPDDADAFFRAALVRLSASDTKGAVKDLDRAIELRPTDAGMLFTRGNANVSLGRLNEALSDLTNAITLLPEQAAFHMARASVLEALGRKADAANDRRRAALMR